MAIDYNRQYIGARYVPTFFNNPDGSWDWAQGFQYEPLTIVKYGTNSFTSKKIVPSTIGSPNLNPDYWANTGDFSGAISSLQQQKANRGYDIKNRSFLLIADSYEEWSQWATTCKSILQNLGCVCDSIYANGAGLTLTTSWLSLFNQMSGNYTDVFIGGGVNDRNANDTSIATAMATLAEAVHNRGCNLHYGFFGDIWQNQPERINVYRTFNSVRNACKNNAVYWMEHAYGMLHQASWFNADGIHPTTTAGNFIANQVAMYLSTLINSYTTSPTAGDVNNIVRIDNGVLYASYSSALSFSNVTVTGKTYTKIGSVIEKLPQLNPSGGIFNLGVNIYTNEGMLNGLLYIFGDDISVNVLDIDGSKTYTTFNIYGFSLVAPASMI